MVTFAVTSLVAIAMLGLARRLLRPRWERLAPYFPVALLHRWSLGSIGLGALFLFFVGPFLLMGEWTVAAAGFAVAAIAVGTCGRDVIAWIVDDLREHRAESRGLFEHSEHCVVHDHFPRK
jgi:hypothetical protein